MADLVCVDPSLIDRIWPHARVLVKGAVDRENPEQFADIEREVLSGLQLLWVIWNGTFIEAVAITRLVMIGERKVCVIVACGGEDRARWLSHGIAGLERFAKNEGCHAMRIVGRKGWERVLEGYRVKYTVLDKELN